MYGLTAIGYPLQPKTTCAPEYFHMQNLSDMCVGAFGFYIVGWGLAFGVDSEGNANPITGQGHFLLLPPFTDFMSWLW